MSNLDLKKKWRTASTRLAAIERQREEALEPTRKAHFEAQSALEEIEQQMGCYLICESCAMPILPGEKYMRGEDPLCHECAPPFSLLLTSPDSFLDAEDEQMTPDVARAYYDEHIERGGSPSDSMARDVL